MSRNQLIDEEEDASINGRLKVIGFKRNILKETLFWIFSIASLGSLPLYCKSKALFVTLRRSQCSLKDATHILIHFESNCFEERVISSNVVSEAITPDSTESLDFLKHVKYFEFRKQRFLFDHVKCAFEFHPATLNHLLPSQLLSQRTGLTSSKADQILYTNGINKIIIDNSSVFWLLIEKLTQLFYLFQIASVTIWLFVGYSTYAYLIFIMSSGSIIWEIYSQKLNEQQLHTLTETDNSQFYVLRDNQIVKLHSHMLVVGDAVLLDPSYLEPNTRVPCDLAIVAGQCLMDESSLTGEIVPVLKLPVSQTIKSKEVPLDLDRNRVNIIYGGSTILQLKPEKNAFQLPKRDSTLEELFDQNSHFIPMHLDPFPSENTSVIAIVLSTGFSTSKGELFRSILFPRGHESQLENDSLKFLAVLGAIAIMAFINKFINGFLAGKSFIYTFLTSLDLITIAVPPALPLILTVGLSFSLNRLKKTKIFCIDPKRLNYAGRMDTMCWDKTGTITVSELHFSSVYHSKSEMVITPDSLDFSPFGQNSRLENFMIVCHGLNRPNGVDYLGHALDIELFRFTGWSIESHSSTVEYNSLALPCVSYICKGNMNLHIVKRFEFDSHLQRSSVIAISNNSPATVYVKGSPEAIKAVSKAGSLPRNYDSIVAKYSMEGFYVISCAFKLATDPQMSNISTLTRDEIELDLEFVGFLLFENPIKKQAFSTFDTLSNANISSIIITGDSALTAIHVSRQLKLVRGVVLIDSDATGLFTQRIVDVFDQIEWVEPKRLSISHGLEPYLHDGQTQFALTGQALSLLYNSPMLDAILEQTIIFSRTKPDQKTFIVEWLIKQGKYVGMCGGMFGLTLIAVDGTNDCGALKAAHVGLALSSAEASIVAPFTSGQKQISDVVILIQEGRCALETSFVGFMYMVLYPLIQLMLTASLNQMGVQLSSNQYLMDDMFLVTLLALFALYTRPKSELNKSVPAITLFSHEIVGTLVVQISLCVLFYIVNFIMVFNAPWFCSISRATSKLSSDFNPIDPSANPAANYPCFPIDVLADTSLSFVIKSHENTALWNFGRFFYVTCILSLSVSSQFRLPFWTNRIFSFYWVFIFLVLSLQLLFMRNDSISAIPGPEEYDNFLSSWFNVAPGIPLTFRGTQLVLVGIHVVISIYCQITWNRYIHARNHNKKKDFMA